MATVERHLLTPYGLRTLAPADPKYRGRYEGDPFSRDSAYHQGTVWPWLMGPFITAYVEIPWDAQMSGHLWQVRINDFPREHMYTLIVDGEEIRVGFYASDEGAGFIRFSVGNAGRQLVHVGL